jgi:hypothetical protein
MYHKVFPKIQEIFEKIKSQGLDFVNSLGTSEKLVDFVHGQLSFPVNKIITKKALTDFLATDSGKEMFKKLKANIPQSSV